MQELSVALELQWAGAGSQYAAIVALMDGSPQTLCLARLLTCSQYLYFLRVEVSLASALRRQLQFYLIA